jgi:signal transduction histidine kinase
LVSRVLVNMLKNALEATPRGGVVSLLARAFDTGIEFSVWNAGEISPIVAARIFERHFSTKGGVGRGLGTYSMKKLGEGCLGGTVGFESGERGTVFKFTLPRS